MREWDVAPAWVHDEWHDRVADAVSHSATPGLLHAQWRTRMEAVGWGRGEVFAPDRLINPALCDYSELHVSEQLKWELLQSVARALACSMLPSFIDMPASMLLSVVDQSAAIDANGTLSQAAQDGAQPQQAEAEDKGKRRKGRKE
jgi:hypothetical protein